MANRKPLFFKICSSRPDPRTKERLDKTLYLNPEIEEELETKLEKLNVGIHVNKLQTGVYYRRPGDSITMHRLFSVEHEIAYGDRSAGLLQFEYKRKLIRLTVRQQMVYIKHLDVDGLFPAWKSYGR
jgi:RNA-dependent RNA polymerase